MDVEKGADAGDLAGDAEQLGTGIRQLGNEMKHAGSTVQDIRADLNQMAQRFRLFNEPSATTENGVQTANH